MEGTTSTMAKKKIERSPESLALADAFIKCYDPKTQGDLQEAFKDMLGPIFESMLNGELENHLGYSTNDKSPKTTDNRRNGSTDKTLKTSVGEVPIKAPRDRDSSFKPVLVPKNKTDVTGIESSVIAMYAKGMSQRDISEIIDNIYGFKLSAEQISTITDHVKDDMNEWQSRPLKKFYTFMFVDCIFVDIKHEHETVNCAVYVILAYDLSGKKDILGLWIEESESSTQWLNIFDEIKSRGVEDVLFISMDGQKGLEEGAKVAFPDVVVQRSIVHLIRNSLKYTRPLKNPSGESELNVNVGQFYLTFNIIKRRSPFAKQHQPKDGKNKERIPKPVILF